MSSTWNELHIWWSATTLKPPPGLQIPRIQIWLSIHESCPKYYHHSFFFSIINNLNIATQPNHFLLIITPAAAADDDDDSGEFWLSTSSSQLQSGSLVFTLWFIEQLLFRTHSSTIWPPLDPLLGVMETHSSLGDMSPVSLTRPPPTQARLVPLCRCFFYLHLIVSMSGCECTTW